MKIKQASISVINILFIGTIFSEALTYTHSYSSLYQWLFRIRIYDIVLALLLVGICFQLKVSFFKDIFCKILKNKKLFFLNVTLISLFLFSNIISIVNKDNNFYLFVKQILGISLHALVFYLLVKLNLNDIKKIFSIYLAIVFYLCCYGIMQQISYILHYKHIVNLELHYFPWWLFENWRFTPLEHSSLMRVNSILPEPSSFCIAALPAFFVSLAVFFPEIKFKFLKKWKHAVIIIAFLMSFSTVGYFGIFCSLCILFFSSFKLRKALLAFFFLLLIVILFFTFSSSESIGSDFNVRISQFFKVFFRVEKLERANQSTYTLLRNVHVTMYALQKNVVFGNGFGSHKISFGQHKQYSLIAEPQHIFLLNKEDANSLLLRLLSETGLVGTAFVFLFIYMHFLPKRRDPTGYLWIINNGILILFIARLLRQGHYFSEGFFFFIWLYYFTKQKATSLIS